MKSNVRMTFPKTGKYVTASSSSFREFRRLGRAFDSVTGMMNKIVKF